MVSGVSASRGSAAARGLGGADPDLPGLVVHASVARVSSGAGHPVAPAAVNAAARTSGSPSAASRRRAAGVAWPPPIVAKTLGHGHANLAGDVAGRRGHRAGLGQGN